MVIKPFDKQRADGDHLVPVDPFIMCINGQIASGKSTVALDLILNKLKHRYHRVVVISPTIDLDSKMEAIVNCSDLCSSNQALADAIYDEIYEYEEDPPTREKLPKYHSVETDDKHTSYSPQIIQDIINEQKYIIQNYGKRLSDRVLLFIDDAPALGIFRKSHADIFAKFAVTLRHYNCSVIFCSQMFKACPKIIRHQITCGVFFMCNDVEKKEIWESFSCNMPYYRWEEYFSILTAKPFEHVTFNLINSPGYKVIKGFTEFIA